MKKLLLLVAFFAATSAPASEKKPVKTAESYMEMLEEPRDILYNIHAWLNGRSNTVVDQTGNVLSIDFSSEETKAKLVVGKNGSVLTVEDCGENDSKSRAVYTFDNQQRITSSENELHNYNSEGNAIIYRTDYNYTGDGRYSTTDRHLFRANYAPGFAFMELNPIPGKIEAKFESGEGLILNFDPNLEECTGVEFLDTDGKPKQMPLGYSSIRVSYTKSDSRSLDYNYYNAQSAISELVTTGLHNLVDDAKDNSYYLSKIEFLDTRGKAVNTTAGLAQVLVDVQANENDDQYAISLRFLDHEGRPVDYKQEACAYSRIEYIDTDTLQQASLYAADGSLTDGPKGVARYCHIESGDNEAKYWLDKQGNYVIHEDDYGQNFGFYSRRSYTDDKGRYVIQTSYRGTTPEERVNCNEGYSDEFIYYLDEYHSHPIQEIYLGADGNPVINTDKGYASRSYKYNENEDVVEESTFGPDGKPIEIQGVARQVYGYRDSGHNYSPDFTWWYNAAGEMITPENMPKAQKKEPGTVSYYEDNTIIEIGK